MTILYVIGMKDIMGRGQQAYKLVSEHGELCGHHFCSSAELAMQDLNNEHCKPKLKARFGEYKIVLLGEDNMTPQQIMEKILFCTTQTS